jgi:hypothetical protein
MSFLLFCSDVSVRPETGLGSTVLWDVATDLDPKWPLCVLILAVASKETTHRWASVSLTEHTKDQPHHTKDQPHHTKDQPHHTEDQPHHTEDQPHHTKDQPHHTKD